MKKPPGTKYFCKRCGKQWESRQYGKPKCCGKCKSAYWDRKPIERYEQP